MIISLFPFPIGGEWMILLCTRWKISFLVSISSSASSYLSDLQTRYLCWSQHLILSLCKTEVKKSCSAWGLWVFPSPLLKQMFISLLNNDICIYENNLIIINSKFVKRELIWQANALGTPHTCTWDLTYFDGLLCLEGVVGIWTPRVLPYDRI